MKKPGQGGSVGCMGWVGSQWGRGVARTGILIELVGLRESSL